MTLSNPRGSTSASKTILTKYQFTDIIDVLPQRTEFPGQTGSIFGDVLKWS